ncbi:MAG: hypothetical protein AAF330_07285, partial [Pseudomonadota bacterium]
DQVMLRTLLILAVVTAPSLSLAAGGGSSAPPKTTNTTAFCEEGFIFDDKTNSCIKAEESSQLTPKEQMDAVRELAYAGRYADAKIILASMDPRDDMVLTYKGFVARKTGDLYAANGFYEAALEANPDNILTRSYMGQGYVSSGRIEDARAQLAQIYARGGRETWAAVSLKRALRSGQTYSY